VLGDMGHDPAHPEKRALEDDLASEFTLRGIERPFDLVKDDIDRYRFAVDGVIEQMRKDDPEQLAQMDDGGLHQVRLEGGVQPRRTYRLARC
jgi:hypothetical protein